MLSDVINIGIIELIEDFFALKPRSIHKSEVRGRASRGLRSWKRLIGSIVNLQCSVRPQIVLFSQSFWF